MPYFKGIQNEWAKVKNDPKYDFFKERLATSIKNEPNRKIIVFTEFSDTANYVYEKLLKDGFARVYKYSSEDSSRANKETIQKNFDAGLDKSKQENDYDIIIATDAISEGFNLHRAGIVINYDIPYNPTRVIQRVGRINRINKKVFEELYIFNFFPTATGEVETRTRAISTMKMDLIHSLLGEDTKIFTKDEDLKNYFAKQYQEEKKKTESLSWDAKYRDEWMRFKNNPEIKKQIATIPHRARIARKFAIQGVVAFAKRNGNFVFAFGKTPEDSTRLSHRKLPFRYLMMSRKMRSLLKLQPTSSRSIKSQKNIFLKTIQNHPSLDDENRTLLLNSNILEKIMRRQKNCV